MRKYRSTLLLTVTLGLLSFAGAYADGSDHSLKPYRAVYGAKYNFLLPFKGTATRELKQTESGQWQLTHHVSSPMIKLVETSLFDWVGNAPRPVAYSYKQTAMTKKRVTELDFDWEKLTAANRKTEKYPPYTITANTFDKLSYQLKLRMDLVKTGSPDTYLVADRRRNKQYQFELLGEEEIDSDVGPLDTLKIRRVRAQDSDRETLIWLAKDWDYLIVKIRQKENGKTYEIVLREAELDGTPVTGVFKD